MRQDGDAKMWSPMLRRRRQRSVEMEEGVVEGDNGDEGGGGGSRGGSLGGNSGSGGVGMISEWRASLSASKEERIERFKQQTMKSVTVTFTPRTIILIYFGIGLLFIPIGATIFAGSLDMRDIGGEIEYSSRCRLGTECVVRFEVKRRIKAPSYMYYVITNMMQNYLTYARSRSHHQLRGTTPQYIYDVMDCCPKLFTHENKFSDYLCTEKEQFDTTENPFNLSQIRNPCGLAAWSLFNDSYTLCRDSTCKTVVNVSDRGIAWSSDVNRYRAGKPPHFTSAINRKVQDERFRVWMRLSAFSRIEKVWARIEEDLQPGTYYMRINSLYDVSMFGGEKFFFITALKWFGGKNLFLGILYIVTGLLCVLIALVMLGTHVCWPRKPAHFDPDLLKAQLKKLTEEQEENDRTIHLDPSTNLDSNGPNISNNSDHQS